MRIYSDVYFEYYVHYDSLNLLIIFTEHKIINNTCHEL